MDTSIIVIAFLMSDLLVAPSTATWLSSEYYRNCPDHLLEDIREIEASGPQEGGWIDRGREAIQGAWDMIRAYSDMREANFRDSDKYFHARGNYDAAQRGPGGAWAAGVISVDARETWQGDVSGRGAEDTAADQEANEWGRNGGDPNQYRPPGLPDRY
nr:serum amyloid A protein-like [Lytechinus pictus]